MDAIEADYLAAARRGDTAEVARLEGLIDTRQEADRARLTGPGALLGAALWYAEQGVTVFPCLPGGKAPATKHGFKDATTYEGQIRSWWAENPSYNIGVPTGHRFDVFDIDGPAGMLAFGDWLDRGGVPRIIGLALTPRGRHYYVPANPEAKNTTGLLPSVDYRGRGGYVIAPPSTTPAGAYVWVHPLPGEVAA